MRYLIATCMVILMTGCASDAHKSTAAKNSPTQIPQTAPATNVVLWPSPAAADGLTTETFDEAIKVVEVRHEETGSSNDKLDGLVVDHQLSDPLQCLIAWEAEQHKSNPWLKTCDAGPTTN
jgi:hypothetical protein